MIDFIITHIEELLIAMSSIVASASVLAALTPTKKDDLFFKYIKNTLDFLALNIGNAKTASKTA